MINQKIKTCGKKKNQQNRKPVLRKDKLLRRLDQEGE